MLRERWRWRLLAAGLLAVATGPAAHGEATVVRSANALVSLDCRTADTPLLECRYRLVEPAPVLSASSVAAGRVLATRLFGPPSEPSIALLLLVDTSRSGRADAIDRAMGHARALADAAPRRYRFGLGTFDTDLHLVLPLGATAAEVAATTAPTPAGSDTTELYRNALDAVRLLAAHPADRRGLVILGDGSADDRAYFHEDVVREAVDAGVAIFGVGLATDPARPTLANLRRLAEATGGRFVASNARLELPADFVAAPFASLEGGGRLEIDLDDPTVPLAPGTVVEITLRTASSAVLADVPLPRGSRPDTAPAATRPAAPSPAVAALPPAGPPPLLPAWWPWPAVGLALVLALVLVALVRRRRPTRRGRGSRARVRLAERVPEPLRNDPSPPQGAYLVVDDGSALPCVIPPAGCAIGRNADNDLVLGDNSVSRSHARVTVDARHRYRIEDLESMNGVFVNGRRRRTATLTDGDRVEIGDVSLHFHRGAPPLEEEPEPSEQGDGRETLVLAQPGAQLDERESTNEMRPLEFEPGVARPLGPAYWGADDDDEKR